MPRPPEALVRGGRERVVGEHRVELLVGELADGDDRVAIGLGGGERREQVGRAVLPGPEVVGGQLVQRVAEDDAIHGFTPGGLVA